MTNDFVGEANGPRHRPAIFSLALPPDAGPARPGRRPPGTVHENRIYSLRLFCDHSYPDRPPAVKFESRVNMTCVNPRDGNVEARLLPVLGNWRREYSMETVLTELR